MAAPCQHHHLPAGVLLHVLDCVMRHAVVPDHLRLAEALEGHALDLVSAEGLLYELLADLVDAALYPGRQLGELLGGEGLEPLCELELGLVVQHLGVHLSNENKVRLPYLFEQLGRLDLGPVSGPYYYGRAAPGERKDRYGK